MQVPIKIILCKSEYICQHSVIKITVVWLQNIENNQSIIFVNNPDKKQDGR